MSDNKKEWLPEETELLINIKRTFKEKKWKLISKSLAKKGFKRSEHECRHKWVNCLNPEINHGQWREEELMILYREYEKNSSQWSIIQKSLPHRTQIKIKNHFYGVLRNILRFVVKYFKTAPGRESEISNKINPNSLQAIYKGEEEYSFMNNSIKELIAYMGYHLDKQKLLKTVEKNIKLYEQLNSQMLKEVAFNESTAQESDSKESLNKRTLNSLKVDSFIRKEPFPKHQSIEPQQPTFMSLSTLDEQAEFCQASFMQQPMFFYFNPNEAYFYGSQALQF